MDQGRLQLNCENHLDECDRISLELNRFAKELNLTSRSLFEINLIIDEIFTNIVLYGFGDKKRHWISMEIEVAEDLARIRIQDDGRPFNPLEALPPNTQTDINDRKIGGLGIYIAKRLSDESDYIREKGKNILIFRKKVKRKETGAEII